MIPLRVYGLERIFGESVIQDLDADNVCVADDDAIATDEQVDGTVVPEMEEVAIEEGR